jgi:hypothetical protein
LERLRPLATNIFKRLLVIRLIRLMERRVFDQRTGVSPVVRRMAGLTTNAIGQVRAFWQRIERDEGDAITFDVIVGFCEVLRIAQKE